ncbi:LOW QUALITY PROTEIN: heavy metal-associated isoprenylated plant protein 7-like [Herrania umbratica]|uniref:LOW QUALITY PROTEIN: heavy metal-associated isoprenylated plant protein 7-like n=1 Tax=Herrania umbratica TaxID=108875 RepID=A0A6J1AKK6_9ROSI|nr:LOW QUALITY PROTEIN: heavy metal-associated isoprenylated plant protein 7-like [Herrania umbratica]
MGEEEKKPAEEKQMEEKKPEDGKKGEEGKKEEAKPAEMPAEEKKEEKKGEESKDEKSKEKSPAPPQEIILKVYMHCEGCARKVRRCLRGFEGVDDVMTDCKSNKVVVKGEKADPLKVLERVQRKSHRQVELLSPIPKPAPPEEKKAEEKEKPKPEEKKEEPQVITVVLKVHMHCEACAQEIKKRIQRMKGVESAEPDLKSSEVTVKGVFDPPKLVEYVYKRTGKHAVIVKQEPENKKEEKAKDANKEEQKGEEGGDKEKKEGGGEENKNKKEGGASTEAIAGAAGPAAAVAAEGGAEETKVVEQHRINEHFYPPRYATEFYAYPQIFSDENPNACSVM